MSAKKTIVSMLAGLTVLMAAGSAFADGVGTVATADEQTRLMTLSVNPVLLAHPDGPVYQFTGEFKGHEDWGFGVLGGYGAMATEQDLSYSLFEVGGQFNYYALGNFNHGLQLGAQMLYRGVDGDVSSELSSSGVRVGPYVGYKIITNLGFTFNGQVGVQYNSAQDRASAERESIMAKVTGTEEAWGPLVRLNVGWSF